MMIFLRDPLAVIEEYKNKLIADKSIKLLTLNGSSIENGLVGDLRCTG